ncbi:MAG: 30S ribosome-binding factor RbfA [Puniceicoccales bacterium]|nr:30S ribosome-binding factor RbfA [Puniceicoccales bacterium]
MADRISRLSELLQRELSILLHGRFCSEAEAITITKVKVTSDLHSAEVFFSTHTDGGETACLEFLNRRRGELKRFLARRIRIRQFPELHFHFDRGQVHELRVYAILDGLAAEKK